MNCKYLNQTIELVPCFKKWADLVPPYGIIDDADVIELMKLVK